MPQTAPAASTNRLRAATSRAWRSIVPPPASPEHHPAGDRFPLLDATRAIAALLIFAYHAGIRIEPPEWTLATIHALTIGVPIFFVISGFLLYRPFALRHLRGDPAPAVAPYAWRRFLRIAPAFWVALTLVILLDAEEEGLGNLVLLYGFAQVYDPATLSLGLGQAWSLNCEIVYYALLPIVAVGVRVGASGRDARARLRWEIGGLLGLLALSIAYKAWFFTFGDLESTRDSAFLFHPGWNLDLFVCGMGLALLSAHRAAFGNHGDRWHRLAGERAGLLWLAALALFAGSVAVGDAYREPVGNSLQHLLRASCSVLVVAPAIVATRPTGLVRRFLGLRFMAALGVVSYSFYLYHQAVLARVLQIDLGGTGAWRDAALIVVALLGAIAMSVASWLLVERPALAQRGRVGGRPA